GTGQSSMSRFTLPSAGGTSVFNPGSSSRPTRLAARGPNRASPRPATVISRAVCQVRVR
ncbi:MAG: hypothetical protein AVDCRST_MAG70-1253, partial [uncultured Thermomicrobiales bacterium]